MGGFKVNLNVLFHIDRESRSANTRAP